jgi:hypothetical protein
MFIGITYETWKSWSCSIACRESVLPQFDALLYRRIGCKEKGDSMNSKKVAKILSVLNRDERVSYTYHQNIGVLRIDGEPHAIEIGREKWETIPGSQWEHIVKAAIDKYEPETNYILEYAADQLYQEDHCFTPEELAEVARLEAKAQAR